MTRRLITLCCCLLPLTASAQTIYRCTDATGGTLISNTRVDKSCKPIVRNVDNAMPAPRPPAAPAASSPGAGTSASPTSFPRIPETTQKTRDGDRRHILEQELAGEQRSLDLARRDLAEQERLGGTSPERLQPYRDRVGQHERNLQAIQKELSALR